MAVKDAPEVLYLTEREAPTTDGWFWGRWWDGGQDDICPWYVDHYDNTTQFYVHTADSNVSLDEFTWYGPLPEVRVGSAP